MSDTVTKWHEMQKDKESYRKTRIGFTYIFVLDFIDGKVYRYSTWNPDTMSIKDFLTGAGHSTKDCKWMVTDVKDVETS